jgi:hypothetical protein
MEAAIAYFKIAFHPEVYFGHLSMEVTLRPL